jgi:hypothetical protein
VVIAQRELFTSLILEVEDELRVLAVLAREDVFPLEHGRVQLRAATQHEALFHDPLHVVTTERLAGAIVARALITHAWKKRGKDGSSWTRGSATAKERYDGRMVGRMAYLGRFEEQAVLLFCILRSSWLERGKLPFDFAQPLAGFLQRDRVGILDSESVKELGLPRELRVERVYGGGHGMDART